MIKSQSKNDGPIKGHRSKLPLYDDFCIDEEVLNSILKPFIINKENEDSPRASGNLYISNKEKK